MFGCVAPPTVKVPLVLSHLQQRRQSDFYLRGKIKIKRTGYGFLGQIQVFKRGPRLRIDILTPLDWPLFSVTVIKKKLSLFAYQTGTLYSDSQARKALSPLMPTGISLTGLAQVLGGQGWFLGREYKLRETAHSYVLLFYDSKRLLKEEIWVGKRSLRLQKIVLRNYNQDLLWRATYKYQHQKVVFVSIKDMLGTLIQVQIEEFKESPSLPPSIFSLPKPISHILSPHP